MTTLTLTTWNVQNLFRPDPGDADAVAVYDAKIPLLAQTIGTLDPDVIGLQEVGSEEALGDLQTALGGAYPHRRAGVQDGRGIACGVLSKLPFVEHADIVDFPQAVRDLHVTDLEHHELTRMGRGAVRVRITKGGLTTDVIVVHLKSKLLTFPGGAFSTHDEVLRAQVAALALLRRSAEAATVRIAAAALLSTGRAVAVLGDFNDGPEAATTALFQGPEGSELQTRGFHVADDGDGARLWNLAPLIDPARRFSRVHRGQGELLDQIFTSQAFFPRQPDGLRRLPLSVDSQIENVRSIGDNPSAEAREARPDHAPVTAVFDAS